MNTQIMLLCVALFCQGTALAQLGINCGEHPDVFRNKRGVAWFSPEQLEKRATKRVEPEMPSAPRGFHYDGYVTFKILVDKNGEIGCIWAHGGNPFFFRAVNEALQATAGEWKACRIRWRDEVSRTRRLGLKRDSNVGRSGPP